MKSVSGKRKFGVEIPKTKQELENLLATKLEIGLKYLEEIQKVDDSEEGKKDLIKSITRTNYLMKYSLCNALNALAENNEELKSDPNFQVRN